MAKSSTWLRGYPIRFTAGGDRTAQALLKGASQEIQKIYGHLNTLNAQLESTETVSIRGFVDSVTELPANASVGFLYAVGSDLYVYNGTDWQQMFINAASTASEDVLGILRLGTSESLETASPSSSDVVTEAMLNRYNASSVRGLPRGAIIMWHETAVPAGWAFCDGSNGTPDLRNRFIRGAETLAQAGVVAGEDSVLIDSVNVQPHSHDFELDATLTGHEHGVNVRTNTAATQHTHGASATLSLGVAGQHTHAIESQGWFTQYRIGTPANEWVSGGAWSIGAKASNIPVEPDHTHKLKAAPVVTQNTATHSHEVTFDTQPLNGVEYEAGDVTEDPHETGQARRVSNRPVNRSLSYIMKL